MAKYKSTEQSGTSKSSSTRAKSKSHRNTSVSLEQLIKILGTNMSNGRIPIVFGFIILVAVFIAFASLVSYLFNAEPDQSLVAPGSIIGRVAQEQEVGNWVGPLGAKISEYLFNGLFGWGIFCILYFFGYWACTLTWLKGHGTMNILVRFVQCTLLAIWISMALSYVQSLIGTSGILLWGGDAGLRLTQFVIQHVGSFGLIILLLASLIITLLLVSDRFLVAVQDPHIPQRPQMPKGIWAGIKTKFAHLGEFGRKLNTDLSEQAEGKDGLDDDQGETFPVLTDEDLPEFLQPREPKPTTTFSNEDDTNPHTQDGLIVVIAPEDEQLKSDDERPDSTEGMPLEYTKPSLDLLREYEQGGSVPNMAEIERNKQRILDTLASFKMHVTPHQATIGPTVTLYEVVPDQGIKVSRIKSLEDDLALNLKSEGIRIIAPMPGKGTIGIEVPNSSPQTVSMRSIMASRRYNDEIERMELPVGIGKTITNEPFIFDLARMPHLLIAGATGQGKSVGLNAMITSLLYSKRPEELKFVMVDPKMLEFSVYEDIEHHFLAKLPDTSKAIITDMSRVVPTLLSLCIEMDNRYLKLTRAKVRNIKEYNQQVRSGQLSAQDGFELLPYIVLIVDEFADLIMTSGKEVEQPIARLAQKARAAGIHMVIATQRPSTDVITGLIKANFPARIAFKVFSMIDSRTILDSPGANQLIGRGDMLFYQGKEMVRIQCAFMDTPESEAIVNHISSQQSVGTYELPEYIPESDGQAKSFNPSEKDPLFEEVARMVVNSQVGSTSNIQRKFNLGYNRAGRLMDQLEGAGIVGAQDGSKPREVLIKDQIALDHLLELLK